jgi:pimeloyl-ACP methyl ester carboxylesterase
MRYRYGPDYPARTYISHAHPEATVDLGEIVMNYAAAGDESAPALLLIPAQTESWWGYEEAMKLLERDFRVYAVDLRGQGRSSRTPGRYTLDNWGNDLVRFIQLVIGRSALVAGNSSGGVLAAWLSAYAPRGLVRAVYLEDPPLFSSEISPACGHGIHQSFVRNLFALRAKYLGDQWSVGDWQGMLDEAPSKLPPQVLAWLGSSGEPPQNLKEYDPEWARAHLEGTATANCDHEQMLRSVKTPVFLSHHFRSADAPNGAPAVGALSDIQASYVRALVEQAGQRFDYRSLSDKPHGLHGAEPGVYVSVLKQWVSNTSA